MSSPAQVHFVVTARGVRFASASRNDGTTILPEPEVIEFRIKALKAAHAEDNVACYLEWEDLIYEKLFVEGPFLGDPVI